MNRERPGRHLSLTFARRWRNMSVSVFRGPSPAGSLLPGQRSRGPVFMLQLDVAGASGPTRALVGRIQSRISSLWRP